MVSIGDAFNNQAELTLNNRDFDDPYIDCRLAGNQCVAVFEDENVRIAWSSSPDGGTQWTTPAQLAFGRSPQVSCTTTACMAVWVLSNDDRADFAVFTNGTWSGVNSIPLTGITGNLEVPSLYCSGKSSTCLVAIMDDQADDPLFLAKTLNLGETWDIKIIASRNIEPRKRLRDPSIACTKDETKCVLAARETDTEGALFVAQSLDMGGTWSTFASLNNSPLTRQKNGAPDYSPPSVACMLKDSCFVTANVHTSRESKNHIDVAEVNQTGSSALATVYSDKSALGPSVSCTLNRCAIAWQIENNDSNFPMFTSLDSLASFATPGEFAGLANSRNTNVYREVCLTCTEAGTCFSALTNSIPSDTTIQIGSLVVSTLQPTTSPTKLTSAPTSVSATRTPTTVSGATSKPTASASDRVDDPNSGPAAKNEDKMDTGKLAAIIVGSVSVPLLGATAYFITRFRKPPGPDNEEILGPSEDDGFDPFKTLGPSRPVSSQGSVSTFASGPSSRGSTRTFGGLRNLPMTPPIIHFLSRPVSSNMEARTANMDV